MGTPIQSRPAPRLQPAPGSVGAGPLQAPARVGGARNVVQSRAPVAEQGYVEMAVSAIFRLISWVFSKLFSCFARTEVEDPSVSPGERLNADPAEAQPPESPQPAEEDRSQQIPAVGSATLPRLVPELQEEIDLLNALNQLSSDAQKRIYTRIGAQERGWRDFSNRDNEALGRQKVIANPRLLQPYFEPLGD